MGKVPVQGQVHRQVKVAVPAGRQAKRESEFSLTQLFVLLGPPMDWMSSPAPPPHIHTRWGGHSALLCQPIQIAHLIWKHPPKHTQSNVRTNVWVHMTSGHTKLTIMGVQQQAFNPDELLEAGMSPRWPPTEAGLSFHDGLAENALPSFPPCPLLQLHLRETPRAPCVQCAYRR